MRLWSKWCWNIHYWVDSEVYAKYHDERLAADGATSRGIPFRTKFKTTLQHQFLCVSGQSDVDIYIIVSPLNHMPSPIMIAPPWMELQAREFPKMRKCNQRYLNIIACYQASSCTFLVKLSFKYTLFGHLWSMCQVPWRTVGCRGSYKQGNSPKDEIKDDATSPVLVRS